MLLWLYCFSRVPHLSVGVIDIDIFQPTPSKTTVFVTPSFFDAFKSRRAIPIRLARFVPP